MVRSWFAVALLAAACGKSKDADVAHGSAIGSESGTGSAPAAPVAVVALPAIAGHGADPAAHPARVSVSPASISVDGKHVLSLEAPNAEAALKIAVIDGLSSPSTAPRFILALDQTIETQLLLQLLRTLETQGLTQYGLLAQKAGGETVMLPIDLIGPGRKPGSDLMRQLDELKNSGSQIKVGPSPGGRKDKDAPAPRADAMSADAAPNTVVVEVREVALSPESSLTTDIAKAKISATYLTGLRRCVKSFAEKDATTASSFTLTFAIHETGMGADAKATGVTDEAAACIATQAASWRFPIPKDADRKGVKVSATVAFDISVDETTVRENAANASMMPGDSASALVEDGLGMTLSITKDELILWSTSGLEGTQKKPHARFPLTDAAKLSAALEELVKRRWGGAKRADHDLAIRLTAEPSTKMQLLAELFASVRATSSGTLLFPTVVLSIK